MPLHGMLPGRSGISVTEDGMQLLVVAYIAFHDAPGFPHLEVSQN